MQTRLRVKQNRSVVYSRKVSGLFLTFVTSRRCLMLKIYKCFLSIGAYYRKQMICKSNFISLIPRFMFRWSLLSSPPPSVEHYGLPSGCAAGFQGLVQGDRSGLGGELMTRAAHPSWPICSQERRQHLFHHAQEAAGCWSEHRKKEILLSLQG